MQLTTWSLIPTYFGVTCIVIYRHLTIFKICHTVLSMHEVTPVYWVNKRMEVLDLWILSPDFQ